MKNKTKEEKNRNNTNFQMHQKMYILYKVVGCPLCIKQKTKKKTKL